jgi:hypothetical protein
MSNSRNVDRESGVGRGIDFQRVANVVNFDFPPNVDTYIHRVGRCVITFVDINIDIMYILVPLAVGHVAQHCHSRLLIIRAKLVHWAKCERC